MRPGTPRQPSTRRFEVSPALLGFEVIDRDGRPVAAQLSLQEAQDAVARLNRAAAGGARHMARFLAMDGAIH